MQPQASYPFYDLIKTFNGHILETVHHGSWDLSTFLGGGSTGVVHEGIHQNTGKHYAVKMINPIPLKLHPSNLLSRCIIAKRGIPLTIEQTKGLHLSLPSTQVQAFTQTPNQGVTMTKNFYTGTPSGYYPEYFDVSSSLNVSSSTTTSSSSSSSNPLLPYPFDGAPPPPPGLAYSEEYGIVEALREENIWWLIDPQQRTWLDPSHNTHTSSLQLIAAYEDPRSLHPSSYTYTPSHPWVQQQQYLYPSQGATVTTDTNSTLHLSPVSLIGTIKELTLPKYVQIFGWVPPEIVSSLYPKHSPYLHQRSNSPSTNNPSFVTSSCALPPAYTVIVRGRTVHIPRIPQKYYNFLQIRSRINREIASMVTVSSPYAHPNVLALHGVMERINFTDDTLYLVLEMASGGELFEKIKQDHSYDETTARYYMKQLLEGVQYLHSKGIIHRDLKPENLLLSDVSVPSSVLSPSLTMRDEEESFAVLPLSSSSSNPNHNHNGNNSPTTPPLPTEGNTHILKIADFGLSALAYYPTGDDSLGTVRSMQGSPYHAIVTNFPYPNSSPSTPKLSSSKSQPASPPFVQLNGRLTPVPNPSEEDQRDTLDHFYLDNNQPTVNTPLSPGPVVVVPTAVPVMARLHSVVGSPFYCAPEITGTSVHPFQPITQPSVRTQSNSCSPSLTAATPPRSPTLIPSGIPPQQGFSVVPSGGNIPYSVSSSLPSSLPPGYDGPKADAWSCGVIGYAMVTGSLPFTDKLGTCSRFRHFSRFMYERDTRLQTYQRQENEYQNQIEEYERALNEYNRKKMEFIKQYSTNQHQRKNINNKNNKYKSSGSGTVSSLPSSVRGRSKTSRFGSRSSRGSSRGRCSFAAAGNRNDNGIGTTGTDSDSVEGSTRMSTNPVAKIPSIINYRSSSSTRGGSIILTEQLLNDEIYARELQNQFNHDLDTEIEQQRLSLAKEWTVDVQQIYKIYNTDQLTNDNNHHQHPTEETEDTNGSASGNPLTAWRKRSPSSAIQTYLQRRSQRLQTNGTLDGKKPSETDVFRSHDSSTLSIFHNINNPAIGNIPPTLAYRVAAPSTTVINDYEKYPVPFFPTAAVTTKEGSTYEEYLQRALFNDAQGFRRYHKAIQTKLSFPAVGIPQRGQSTLPSDIDRTNDDHGINDDAGSIVVFDSVVDEDDTEQREESLIPSLSSPSSVYRNRSVQTTESFSVISKDNVPFYIDDSSDNDTEGEEEEEIDGEDDTDLSLLDDSSMDMDYEEGEERPSLTDVDTYNPSTAPSEDEIVKIIGPLPSLPLLEIPVPPTDINCPSWFLPEYLSKEIKEVLINLLHPLPERRYTVKQALESSWFGNKFSSPYLAPSSS